MNLVLEERNRMTDVARGGVRCPHLFAAEDGVIMRGATALQLVARQDVINLISASFSIWKSNFTGDGRLIVCRERSFQNDQTPSIHPFPDNHKLPASFQLRDCPGIPFNHLQTIAAVSRPRN